ncbi:Meiotic recombination protein rec12 [Colletotrichum siamense]|uniref:Meiotic recombination protein rec12 n=1 Tax=Colletotrichum siamense TaxID=690259 RepID=UPI0018733DDB|nr:Meiotic recombination protein rec12 [Colletotrichum siamense]KAF5505504.1 Meiotic recombination protein rec12 [Colletotrichum siamense]
MDNATLHMTGRRGQLTRQPAYQSSPIVDIPDPDPDNNVVGIAIAKLQEILISVYQSLENKEVLRVPYKTRPGSRRNPPSAARATRSRSAPSVLQFPGRTENESIKFAQVLKIIHLSHSSLLSGNPVTKRNLFYQCPDLFKTQAIVDGLVDDISHTLGMGRDDLNIVASAKGLLSGPITLHMRDSSSVSASASDTGVTIPTTRNISKIDFQHAEWVLVVEKDASPCKIPGQDGMLTSGKGVPDLQTKQFLHLLHSAKPEIPIYGLVDFDPYGVNIMRCYSHGSRGHAHEVGVTVPSMQWLGIKSDDLLGRRDLEVDDDSAFSRQQQSESSFDATDALKERDRKIAKTLLRNISADFDEYNIECRRELQIMLFLNVKAEIQAVDDAGDISNWLDVHMARV